MDMDVDMAEIPLHSAAEGERLTQNQLQTINPSVLVNGRVGHGGEITRNGALSATQTRGLPSNMDGSNDDDDSSEMASSSTTSLGDSSHSASRLSSDHSELTGLYYDSRMRYHTSLIIGDDHPEDPRRISTICRIFTEAGLIRDGETTVRHPEDQLYRIPARKATHAEICLVHTLGHYRFVKGTKTKDEQTLLDLSETGDSVYYNAHTFTCAKLAAGGAIDTCKAVISGELKNAIAVIRPPGHHAVPAEAQGFCIFNNVSVAAKACQVAFPDKCRKILIFDWDVHHGNGTQDTFYEDPNVLYMSIHVYAEGRFYPCRDSADHNHCGEGRGLGKNVNVAWTEQGMGNAEYMYAFQQVIMPIAWEFDPDLVIVSAGFDAAEGDQIGGCFVTPTCYAQMTHALMCLAKGKIVICLEGGYNLRSTAMSALAVTRTLMGEAPDRLELNKISKIALEDVHKARRRQSPYWFCMGAYRMDEREPKGDRLQDIIRSYHSRLLKDKHAMSSLPILRTELSESFENEVMANNPRALEAKTLLVIIHDPLEVIGLPDPVTDKVEAHNAWVGNALTAFIDWACDQGYGVIDANIPKHLTSPHDEDDDEAIIDEDEHARLKSMRSLVLYLWDNYIQLSCAEKIIIMGVGDVQQGVLHLLNSRGVVNFVNEVTLRPVQPEPDSDSDDLEAWYHKNSLVYVNSDHDLWEPGKNPPRKKFGRVKKSPKNDINAMLEHHKAEVIEWIGQRAGEE